MKTPLSPLHLMTAALCMAATTAQAQEGTLDRIAASGTIHVGYREASVPFSYLDGTRPVGFAMDLCGGVVEAVKTHLKRPDIKVEMHPVTSANRMPLLQNKTIDIECGSTTNNTTRAQQVAFSINHFYTGTRLLTRKDSGITKVEDLGAKPLVTTAGTTNFQVLRKYIFDRKLDTPLVTAKDHADALLYVESGRAAAFGMDDILLYGQAANARNPQDWAIVGEALQVEPYAVMLRKDDPAFKKLVDATLVKTIQSGEFEKLYSKWFQSPIPPRGVNLNVPMSAELRQHLKSPSDKPNL